MFASLLSLRQPGQGLSTKHIGDLRQFVQTNPLLSVTGTISMNLFAIAGIPKCASFGLLLGTLVLHDNVRFATLQGKYRVFCTFLPLGI